MPAKKTPTSIIVIAVFHFIFAFCGLAGVGLQGTGLAKELQKMGDKKQVELQEKMERKMNEKIPGWEAYQTFSIGLSLAMSILLFACGIGLLQLKPWARLGSIGYAIISIAGLAFGMVYTVLYVMPVLKEVLLEAAPQDKNLQQVMEFSMNAGAIGGACAGLIYPVVILIVMFLPKVKLAFSGQDFSRPEDYDDTYDYERRPEDDEG